MNVSDQRVAKERLTMSKEVSRDSVASHCYTARCFGCEGTGTRPSALYLIPFWPTMLCKRCNGSGIEGVDPYWSARVYEQSVRLLRKAMIGDQNFVQCLQGDDAAVIRLALMDLEDAVKESV